MSKLKQIGDLTVEYSDNLEYINHNKVNENELNIEFNAIDNNKGFINANINNSSDSLDINLNPQDCDYYFESIQDFNSRINQICKENNNDLSQKKFCFSDNVTSYTFKEFEKMVEEDPTVEERMNEYFIFFPKSITHTPKYIVAKNLKSAYFMFFNIFDATKSQLTTISPDLFKGCHNILELSGVFYNCTLLTEIPLGLFDDCTQVTSLNSCFGATKITTIPEGLFNNCTQVTDFNSCFSYCSSLTSIPEGLFDNCTQVISFNSCFSWCYSITSNIPDAWNKEKHPNVTDYTDYAYNCTKALNYNEIPEGWKN